MVDIPGMWSDESQSEETVKGSQTYTYAWSYYKEKSSTDSYIMLLNEETIKGTTFTESRYKRVYKYSDEKNKKIDKGMMFKMLEPIYKIIKEFKTK